MKRRVWGRRVLWVLVPVVLLTSGCVYLRLLHVKRQLQKFDDHFVLSGDKDLQFDFKNPVMFAQDIRFLVGAPPARKWYEDVDRVWRYDFRMVRHTAVEIPSPLETLSLHLFFNPEFRLVRIIVPERFLVFFPRPLFVETLRQAAHANVYELKRTVHGRFTLTPDMARMLPSRERAVALLGTPLAVRSDHVGVTTLIYRYRITSEERPVPLIIRLFFNRNGRLVRVRVTWDTATVDAEYTIRQ